MPTAQITDPFGVNGTGVLIAGSSLLSVYNADTVNLYQGQLVQVVNPATATAFSHISVKKFVSQQGTTTIAPMCIGVVSEITTSTGGTDPGVGLAFIPPGGVGNIVTQGWTMAQLDAGSGGTSTPTAGHVLQLGQANGCLTDSGATTGTVNRTFGTVLDTQNAFLTVSSQSAATTVLTLVLSAGLPTSTDNVDTRGATGTTNNPVGEFTRTANSFNPSNTSSTTTAAGTYFVYKTTVANDTIAMNLGSTIGTLGGTAILSFGILYPVYFRFS